MNMCDKDIRSSDCVSGSEPLELMEWLILEG